MKTILFILLFTIPIFAQELLLQKGSIKAHTEMLMDSEIDPFTQNLKANLSITNKDITSLRGEFWVDMNSFVSDKSDRDENMYEELDTDTFKLARYTITSITKSDAKDTYLIEGNLNFHGVDKKLTADANIFFKDGILFFEASSLLMMSEYGVEMPCMMFMCVREQIDLTINATLSED